MVQGEQLGSESTLHHCAVEQGGKYSSFPARPGCAVGDGAKRGGDERRGPCRDGLALGYSVPSLPIPLHRQGLTTVAPLPGCNPGAQSNIPGAGIFICRFYHGESISQLVLAASGFVEPHCLGGAWLLNAGLYIRLVLT